MQIIRFKTHEGKVCLGTDYDGHAAWILAGDIFGRLEKTGHKARVEALLPPIDPVAILCIGLNYRRHARETGLELPEYPVVFMKNPGAALAHNAPVVIPGVCSQKPETDYEAELGVVIKTAVKNVGIDTALTHVLGYVCANDISARRWQKHGGGGQWVRGKSFDTFCPMGPALVTREEIKDVQDLEIECRLNGQTMQKSSTGDMIFSVAQIISYLSQSTTILPGTLILTGTPEGVGFTRKPPVYLMPGDALETRIQGLGILKNPVAAEKG